MLRKEPRRRSGVHARVTEEAREEIVLEVLDRGWSLPPATPKVA